MLKTCYRRLTPDFSDECKTLLIAFRIPFYLIINLIHLVIFSLENGIYLPFRNVLIHYVSKNDSDVAHYNFNEHQLISLIFGRDIAE